MAAAVVLLRKPAESFKKLIAGGAFAAPLVVGLALARAGLLTGLWTSMGDAARIVSTVTVFFVGLVLFSGAAHCLIRAFELGVDSAQADERAAEGVQSNAGSVAAAAPSSAGPSAA